MGLNSGEVVVGAIGEDLGMEYTAIGHTVGLAQRIEQLAAADKVYVTQYTASLVEGYLALTDLGEFQLKGASGPLRVHELTGVGAAQGRLDVQRGRGLSRFVGREEELATLQSVMERAFAGNGQVIGIVGEAGVGKSRLCHEFAECQRAKGTPTYHVAGQAHAKSIPLLPLLQFLRSYFEIADQDSDRAARERIAGKLLLLDKTFEEDLPLIFDFLAVPDPLRPAPRMDPEARQRQLLAFMKRLNYAQSAREPAVIVIEDLHWLDPASEVYLANRVEAVQGTRSLTVVNFRPDYRAPWMSHSYYRQIALAPLGAEATEALLSDLLGRDPSLDGLAELIRARTGGNPFFIEELVQTLSEGGSLQGKRGAYRLVAAVQQDEVPASVQAVLAARIDRLSQREKDVLQAAAVIGKEFPQPVLEGVLDLAPVELEEALRDLVAGEFIYEQELYPESLYAFKHPLTREVAYGSQLGERRGGVHAAVAQAIAEHYPERLEERAALLAQHWEAAGETLEAARWHAHAAAWSGSGDPTQALRHWRSVRELTNALPESEEAVALGLKARISSLNYGWRLGISHEKTEDLFNEAERIATETGDLRSRALLFMVYAAVRGIGDGDLREYARLARQAIELAEESGDPALYLTLATNAYAFFCVGEYREALAICDRAIDLADGDPTVGAGVMIGSPYALCVGTKGQLLGELGDLEEACRLIEQARKLAYEQGDTETVGFNHMRSTALAYFQGQPETALSHGEQVLEIAERSGSSFARAHAWFWLGLAERMRGEWRLAIEGLERSQAIAREMHTAIEVEVWRLALLGESYLGLGDPERARALVEEALAFAVAQGHAPYEIHARLALARVLLGSAGIAERKQIQGALARALQLTRDTGAKAYEPLIHVELAELARQSGEEEERQRELREAHRLFTEIGASGRAEGLAGELATRVS
jgi:adenylate cyclase